MIIEKNTIYKFKEEFCPALKIGVRAWKDRKEDLLAWLTNFFDYELYEGRPIRIFIKEIIGEYQPLPRKVNNNELTLQKKADYKTFTIASLGTEFKPNSKAKTTREALNAFGNEKYGHINVQSISKRYVGPIFDEYGESDDCHHWVWYSTYEPLNEAAVQRWRAIMAEEQINETKAASAFYLQEQGEDISAMQDYFKRARQRFKQEFGDNAVLVSNWRLKREV